VVLSFGVVWQSRRYFPDQEFTMFNMFRQMFLAFQTLFSAFEKSAKALEHLASWGEEAAGTYADEARLERQQRIAELRRQRQEQIKAIEAA